MVFDLLGNTDFKYLSHVKIQLFMTLKSGQDPDPHWFGSLDPDPLLDKKTGSESESTLKQMRIQKNHNCKFATLTRPKLSLDHLYENFLPHDLKPPSVCSFQIWSTFPPLIKTSSGVVDPDTDPDPAFPVNSVPVPDSGF